MSALYSIAAYLVALFLIIFGLSNGGMISGLFFAASLAFLCIGYVVPRSIKPSTIGNVHFKVVNGISITYLTLTIFFIALALLSGVSIDVVGKHIFTPFNLDFKRLCCLDGGLFVRYTFYGLAFLIAISFYISGSTEKKSLRTLGTTLGIFSVLLWYGLAFLFFLISGLGH